MEIPLRFNSTIVVSASVSPEEAGIWSLYPMARMEFIARHQDLYEGQIGLVVPTFGEEYQGRYILVNSCEDLRKRDQPVPSTYLKDLLKVHNAGYLKEYVWLFLARPAWKPEEQPPELLSFIPWARGNLSNHVVETHGEVKINHWLTPGMNPPKPAVSSRSKDERVVEIERTVGDELRSSVIEIQQALKNGEDDEIGRLLQIFSAAAANLQKETNVTICLYSK